MTGLVLTVPVACWRMPHAREYLESYDAPPPSTCYGFLLSLVGEEDRNRHRGVRLSMACNEGPVSTILRTVWRVKKKNLKPGTGENARPDYQELVTERRVAILLDSSEETLAGPTLEERVRAAIDAPDTVTRYGGLSLGESSHLVNDIWRNDEPDGFRFFAVDGSGETSLPVWVDHVGASATTYATGSWNDRIPAVASMVSMAPK